MDYCLAGNQIGNYASSGAGSCCDPLVVKNIDCVSLESDTITANSLTINGDELDVQTIYDLEDKTMNQTSSTLPPATTFTGLLETNELKVVGGALSTLTLNTNTIQPFTSGSTISINAPISVSGSITAGDTLSVNNTTTTSGMVLASFLQSNLGNTTPQSTQSASIILGKSTSTAESAYIRYTRDTTSANNNLALGVTGSNPLQIYSSYINIPSELRIANNILRPRINTPVGNFTASSQITLVSSLPTTTAGLKRVIVTMKGVRRTTTASPFINFNDTAATTATYTGLTRGNNASNAVLWSTGTNAIKLWNNDTTPAATAGYTRSFDFTVIFDYMGPIGGLDTWIISGQGNDVETNIATPTNVVSTYWVEYSGTVQMKTAGTFLSSLLIRAVSTDTGTFEATGNYGVMYY